MFWKPREFSFWFPWDNRFWTALGSLYLITPILKFFSIDHGSWILWMGARDWRILEIRRPTINYIWVPTAWIPCPEPCIIQGGVHYLRTPFFFLVTQISKESSWIGGLGLVLVGRIPGRENSPDSSGQFWRCAEEPGGLQVVGFQKIRHNWWN